ncbi:MAG: acyl--CoA ligase [Planctomycetes bacterium]|nr:acyl--CoA ligase [Planctomycetota bacterium]
MALWRILRDAANQYPKGIAVTSGGRDYTYAELDDLVERVATGLRFQGLGPTDRLLTVLGNTIEHLALILGCFRAGVVAVPMAAGLISTQIRYALRTSGARGIAAARGTLANVFSDSDLLRPDITISVGDPNPARWMIPWEVIEAGPGDSPEQPDPKLDHLGLILFTSGTTSRPKAVTHTQNRMARRSAAFAHEVGLTAADVAFVVHPIGRPLTLLGQILGTFKAGGRVVLHDGGASGFWRAYATGVPKTFVITLPWMASSVLEDPAAETVDHSRLRLWMAGGDAVPPELQVRFKSITGRPIVEMCGMTEAGFYALNPTVGSVRIGSMGRPMRGVEVRIIDPEGTDVPRGSIGEILLRSPDLMAGYWNDTAATFNVIREGWLYTGDLARMDCEGFLWFAGRTRDLINRGGRKVAPPMVEEALAKHPAVKRAVVVGAPAPVGQVPFAFLALQPGAACPCNSSLRDWLADKLDPPEVPDDFLVIDEWPLTYQGKVDRARLGWIAANGGIPV